MFLWFNLFGNSTCFIILLDARERHGEQAILSIRKVLRSRMSSFKALPRTISQSTFMKPLLEAV